MNSDHQVSHMGILPGLAALEAIAIVPRRSAATDAVCFLISADGDVPSELGLGRDELVRLGFDAQLGQSLLMSGGERTMIVAIGVGDEYQFDAARLRDAAAAAARAARRFANVAIVAPSITLSPVDAVRAIVEGAILARYRYDRLKSRPDASPLLVELAVEITGADEQIIDLGGSGSDDHRARSNHRSRPDQHPARLLDRDSYGRRV